MTIVVYCDTLDRRVRTSVVDVADYDVLAKYSLYPQATANGKEGDRRFHNSWFFGSSEIISIGMERLA